MTEKLMIFYCQENEKNSSNKYLKITRNDFYYFKLKKKIEKINLFLLITFLLGNKFFSFAGLLVGI